MCPLYLSLVSVEYRCPPIDSHSGCDELPRVYDGLRNDSRSCVPEKVAEYSVSDAKRMSFEGRRGDVGLCPPALNREQAHMHNHTTMPASRCTHEKGVAAGCMAGLRQEKAACVTVSAAAACVTLFAMR